MSFNPNHIEFCDPCACWRCQKTYKNSQEQIWLHQGFGCFDKMTFEKLPVPQMLELDNVFTKPRFESVFKQLEEKHEFYHQMKPFGCIWFSNGSWLYDPYCDGSHDGEKPESYKVFVTKNPHNVLQITTYKELEAFTNKYAVPKSNDKIQSSEDEDEFYNKNTLITWLDVYNDGYYGVAFNFRKVSHIAPVKTYFERYFWHCAFDVESLCIFDLRAIQNLTIENVDF